MKNSFAARREKKSLEMWEKMNFPSKTKKQFQKPGCMHRSLPSNPYAGQNQTKTLNHIKQ